MRRARRSQGFFLLTPQRGSRERVDEEALAADPSALADADIPLRMQSVEEGAVDKVRWPDCEIKSTRRNCDTEGVRTH